VKYRAKVEVRLKAGHSDPEGEATKQSLLDLEYFVESVRVSKIYEIFLEAKSRMEANKQVNEICKRLLANPVKDGFSFQVYETK